MEATPIGAGQAVLEVGPRRRAGAEEAATGLRPEEVPGVVPTRPEAEAIRRLGTPCQAIEVRDARPIACAAMADVPKVGTEVRTASPTATVPSVGLASTAATTTTASTTSTSATTTCATTLLPSMGVVAAATMARVPTASTTATSTCVVVATARVGKAPRRVAVVPRAPMATPSGRVHATLAVALATPRPTRTSPIAARVGLVATPTVLDVAVVEATEAPSKAVGRAPRAFALVPLARPTLLVGLLPVASAVALSVAPRRVPRLAVATTTAGVLHFRVSICGRSLWNARKENGINPLTKFGTAAIGVGSVLGITRTAARAVVGSNGTGPTAARIGATTACRGQATASHAMPGTVTSRATVRPLVVAGRRPARTFRTPTRSGNAATTDAIAALAIACASTTRP